MKNIQKKKKNQKFLKICGLQLYKLLVHLLSSEALFYESTYEFKYDFSGNIN